MALSHFTFIPSMNPCKYYQVIADVAVHYQLDHHFRKQSLTREYAIISSSQQIAQIYHTLPGHRATKQMEQPMTSEAYKQVPEKHMNSSHSVAHGTVTGHLQDTVGAWSESGGRRALQKLLRKSWLTVEAT